MIEIYLDGKRVVHDGKDIKIIKENPFFTQAGSYTLKISLPLHIFDNRKVLGDIDKIIVSKTIRHYHAKIILNNKEIFDGSAILCTANGTVAEIQLVGGNSEVNFYYKYEKTYIDELPFENVDFEKIARAVNAENEISDLGYDRGIKGRWALIDSYDTVNDRLLNRQGIGVPAVSPAFLFTFFSIITSMGYSITKCDYIREPFEDIYILSGATVENDWKMEDVLRRTLPHWTVKDFMTEVQNLLNCTVEFKEKERTVQIICNAVNVAEVSSIEVTDDFSTEIKENEHEKTICSSNIAYGNISDGQAEAWPKSIHEDFEHKLFKNLEELRAYVSIHGEEAQKYILSCPECNAVYRLSDNTLICNDYYGMKYTGSDESVDLKISPAVSKWVDTQGIHTSTLQVSGPNANVAGETVMPHQVLLDDASYETKGNEKADEMLLVQTKKWVPGMQEYLGLSLHASTDDYPSVFVRKTGPTIGDLHKFPLKIKDNILYKYKVLSKSVPEVTGIFCIRSKRYLCKKIEYTIKENAIHEIMDGEFYEIES